MRTSIVAASSNDPGRALAVRINEVLAMPTGSAAVDFIYQFEVERTVASDNVIVKGVFPAIEYGGADRPERFAFQDKNDPLPDQAGYNSDGTLELIDNGDIEAMRFTVTPSGGVHQINSLALIFSVRVNSGATPESYVVDNIAAFEVIPEPASLVLMGLGALMLAPRRRAERVK